MSNRLILLWTARRILEIDAPSPELTTLVMKEFADPFPHTDSNTLQRIK